MTISYRSDIDGLRAVAVTAVVLYHAHAGITGGFVGVDVFFVLSGFLITSILVQDVRERRFSLLRFYERRMRRIFPALFVLIAFALVVAYLVFLPQPFREFQKSVIAATLSASNISFWTETSYFGAAAEVKPLLHTWSLGVEEQFYIFFPPVLWAAYRFAPRAVSRLLLLALIGSLALSIWAVRAAPGAAFYLAPPRFWELLVGAAMATSNAIAWLRGPRQKEALALIGLGLIAGPALYYSAQTPFPGLGALPPCLGAALLIEAGRDGVPRSVSWLSSRPFVFVGKVSYSWYLWHWPLLVFYRYWRIETPARWEIWSVIALSFALAVLSWRLVEQPFRTGAARTWSRARVFAAGLAGMALFAGVGGIGYFGPGYRQRWSAPVLALAASAEFDEPTCIATSSHFIPPEEACVHGAVRPASVALWGDSHAEMFATNLEDVARQGGFSFYEFTYAGCPPLPGVLRLDDGSRRCAEFSERVRTFLLAHHEVTRVVFSARVSSYTQGRNIEGAPTEGLPEPWIGEVRGEPTSLARRERLYDQRFTSLVQQLLDAGKEITLIYPVPFVGCDVPPTLALRLARGYAPETFFRSFGEFERREHFAFAMLDGLGESARIQRVYPHRVLCAQDVCRVFQNGSPLYRDDSHLSLEGARLVTPLLSDALVKNSAASF